MKTPPPRLLEDPNAPPELRDDLRRAAAAPVAYDSAVGLATLQAALLIPPAPPAPGPEVAAHGTAATLTTKLTLATLATALTIGLTTLAWPHPTPQHLKGDGPAILQSGLGGAAAPTVPATTTAPTADRPVASPLVQASTPDRLPARPLPADPDGRLRREIAQLARIKALLPAHPGDALQLAQAGNREFARGLLVQEREGIAVLALAQLGREREAAARAHSFLTRFPDSPLRERIALIAGEGAH